MAFLLSSFDFYWMSLSFMTEIILFDLLLLEEESLQFF